MKQVTYEIRGLVIETMIPAIVASCESLSGVRNVRVSVKSTDAALLTLVVEGEVTDALEADLGRIMTAKGLELITPATEGEPVSSVIIPPADSVEAERGRPVAHTPQMPPEKGKKISLYFLIREGRFVNVKDKIRDDSTIQNQERVLLIAKLHMKQGISATPYEI